MLRPASGNITNGFRAVAVGGKAAHLALDFGWGSGRDVFAADAGIITYDTSPGYGLRASIKHASGKFSRYAHLLRAVAPVGPVAAGEHIAVMGSSGSFAKDSKGVPQTHLHFEVLVPKGAGLVRVDPSPYLTGTASSGTTPITPNVPPAPAIIEEDDHDMPLYILYAPDPNVGFIVTPGVCAVKLPRAQFDVLLNAFTLSRGGGPAKLPLMVIGDPGYWALAWASHAPGLPIPGQVPEGGTVQNPDTTWWADPTPNMPVNTVVDPALVAAINAIGVENDEYQATLLERLAGITPEDFAAEVIRQQKLPGN